jgi:protein O-GlcNAc transferase
MQGTAHYQQLMDQGSALHRNHQPDLALVEFEKALALDMSNPHAASACATVLSELDRPRAAYAVLQGASAALMAYADGAANLAIAAQACGAMADAKAGYQQALLLDPNHVRSLNNTALLDSAAGQWDSAIAKLRQCTALLPQEAWLHLNLIDTLIAARQFGTGLQQVASSIAQCGLLSEFRVRQAVLLALNGDLAFANTAFAALGPDELQIYRAWLDTSTRNAAGVVRPPSAKQALPDARTLFLQHVFGAMQVCDWRMQAQATQAIADMVVEMAQTGRELDLREAQFYALLLPLSEAQQTSLRLATGRVIQHLGEQDTLHLKAVGAVQDERIHLGISCESLADGRYKQALLNQLQQHDASRFRFTLYSPTLQPNLADHALFLQAGVAVVEVAHMSDKEAALRIRWDRLDIWMDTAFYTPWCRPELPALRVAPIQIRQQTWQRVFPPIPCEYAVGDHFTHPGDPSAVAQTFGNIVRFPLTCWLTTDAVSAPVMDVSRADVGLAEGAFVMYCGSHALMIDPLTFATWMSVLHAQPSAVLWFPGYSKAARQNLHREAIAAGIDAERLIFCDRVGRAEHLARIALADVFVDTLRFNSNQGLTDALQVGLPAVTAAGGNMASRLGGSILGAAGLADCVVNTPDEYASLIVRLAQSPEQLAMLRGRLCATAVCQPLFDIPNRLREWEYAWSMMVQNLRSNQPPVAFDIPKLTSKNAS